MGRGRASYTWDLERGEGECRLTSITFRPAGAQQIEVVATFANRDAAQEVERAVTRIKGLSGADSVEDRGAYLQLRAHFWKVGTPERLSDTALRITAEAFQALGISRSNLARFSMEKTDRTRDTDPAWQAEEAAIRRKIADLLGRN